ncbi:MAG: serine acetyltransferase [Clostridia bacterium]|nr:serine acetyltransferase [Clostridia bacterium]
MTVKPPKMFETMTIVEEYFSLLFPDLYCDGVSVELFRASLFEIISRTLIFLTGDSTEAERLSGEIADLIPEIKARLVKDATAAYEGDPAAVSIEEIILCYPGFYATAIYRLAHEMYLRSIPCLPRMLTEAAHRVTGIDIHPGATIGEYFFIDHGTGVVIGETAEIGKRVKIYQGVTLGAKSFDLDGDGNPKKGGKRHPKIGNNCIIYAGATILGGDTVIGDNCIIGGNVWLTHSVPTGQKIYYKEK